MVNCRVCSPNTYSTMSDLSLHKSVLFTFHSLLVTNYFLLFHGITFLFFGSHFLFWNPKIFDLWILDQCSFPLYGSLGVTSKVVFSFHVTRRSRVRAVETTCCRNAGQGCGQQTLVIRPFLELRASRELSAPGCPFLTGVVALSLTVFVVNSRTLSMTYYKVLLTNAHLKFLFST